MSSSLLKTRILGNFFVNFKNEYIFGSKILFIFFQKYIEFLLIFPSASSSFASFTIKANLCCVKINCKDDEVGFKCILFRFNFSLEE